MRWSNRSTAMRPAVEGACSTTIDHLRPKLGCDPLAVLLVPRTTTPGWTTAPTSKHERGDVIVCALRMLAHTAIVRQLARLGDDTTNELLQPEAVIERAPSP